MDDALVQFLRNRLDEEALWATEASRRHDSEAAVGGVHWHWVEPEADTPVVADPSRDEYLTDDAGNFRFALRSVEEFPTEHVGLLPQFAISSAEEIPAAVAGHIARHDPARVLAELEAKRRIMECHESWVTGNGDTICGRCGREHIDGRPGGHFPCQTLRLLALPYADHPDYRQDWKP